MTIKAIPPAHQFTYEGTMLRVYHANKGEGLPIHNHTYSHVSYCSSGSVAVRKEGRELIITKDTQPVNLVAVEWHELEALEDGTVFCNIFSMNHADELSNYIP